MSHGDVSNNPLNVIIDLYYNAFNQGAADNASYTRTQEPLVNLLNQKLLPANIQASLMQLEPLLTQNFGDFFNSAYAKVKPELAGLAASMFQKQAGSASVSNVACSLPSGGTVIADASPAQSATQPGSLTLTLHLPGCNFTFNGPALTAWIINFDADLVISMAVPQVPFNLAPTVTVVLSNAAMHPNNAAASFDEWIDNALTSIGNFFTGGLYVSTISQLETGGAIGVDQAFPIPQMFVDSVTVAFNMLNGASAECASAGFTECAFSVEGGNTLTLTITHPLDDGPVLINVYDPAGGIVLNVATLTANVSQALPGTPITAFGKNFPFAASTVLSLQWPNTASGTPTQTEIVYNPGNVTDTIQTPSGFDPRFSQYSLTPGSLQPNTVYTFQARCGDQLTWSKWGPPLMAGTASTDLVTLTLDCPVGASTLSTPIGSAPLSTSSGDWTCAGQIPPTTAPGNCMLTARRAGDVIAAWPIVIVDTLTSTLDVTDPSGTGIVAYPIYGGSPFTLRGNGFPNGPVTIVIDGKTVATPTAQNGTFLAALTTPGGPFTVETVALTASIGAVSASLNPPIYLQGLAK